MARTQRVERPTKRTEYEIYFGSRDAEAGWRDLRATKLNAITDAWDFLTRTQVVPLLRTINRTGAGSLRGQLVLEDDWDSDEMNEAIAAGFGVAR